MKLFAIAAIIIALFLLYRIACPKPPERKNGDAISDGVEVVGKSRFVLNNQRQPQPTPATSAKPENRTEKANTFAPSNEKTDAVSLPEEDDEDFCLMTGRDAELADGYSYEEMTQAFNAEDHPSSEKAQAAGEVLYRLEKTDLFEQLISGDTGRAARVKALLDRHERENEPEANADDNDNEYGDFDIAGFLS